ncbi:hypothetical protein B0H16DRAFT_1469976 [Mycena metata]|uniref:Uncharacterized protein n=1 Tax=Mycena metata TaxID=1033252 RepID=A0AAD7HW36_9AGAR|nr:hypothetical protein B0H16DRAFT_1469976 [Mycena metata]
MSPFYSGKIPEQPCNDQESSLKAEEEKNTRTKVPWVYCGAYSVGVHREGGWHTCDTKMPPVGRVARARISETIQSGTASSSPQEETARHLNHFLRYSRRASWSTGTKPSVPPTTKRRGRGDIGWEEFRFVFTSRWQRCRAKPYGVALTLPSVLYTNLPQSTGSCPPAGANSVAQNPGNLYLDSPHRAPTPRPSSPTACGGGGVSIAARRRRVRRRSNLTPGKVHTLPSLTMSIPTRVLAALQQMQPLRAYTLAPLSRAVPTQTRSVGGVDLAFAQSWRGKLRWSTSSVLASSFATSPFSNFFVHHHPLRTYAAVAAVLVHASSALAAPPSCYPWRGIQTQLNPPIVLFSTLSDSSFPPVALSRARRRHRSRPSRHTRTFVPRPDAKRHPKIFLDPLNRKRNEKSNPSHGFEFPDSSKIINTTTAQRQLCTLILSGDSEPEKLKHAVIARSTNPETEERIFWATKKSRWFNILGVIGHLGHLDRAFDDLRVGSFFSIITTAKVVAEKTNNLWRKKWEFSESHHGPRERSTHLQRKKSNWTMATMTRTRVERGPCETGGTYYWLSSAGTVPTAIEPTLTHLSASFNFHRQASGDDSLFSESSAISATRRNIQFSLSFIGTLLYNTNQQPHEGGQINKKCGPTAIEPTLGSFRPSRSHVSNLPDYHPRKGRRKERKDIFSTIVLLTLAGDDEEGEEGEEEGATRERWRTGRTKWTLTWVHRKTSYGRY